MSLESDRRAIGTALTASRSAISASMQASRASTFKRDLNALETGTRKTVELSTVEEKGARPATRGVSVYVAPSSGTGGGISSPLTETDFAAREYWSGGVMSSDGIFMIPAIKTIALTDADGAAVVVNLAEPA